MAEFKVLADREKKKKKQNKTKQNKTLNGVVITPFGRWKLKRYQQNTITREQMDQSIPGRESTLRDVRVSTSRGVWSAIIQK